MEMPFSDYRGICTLRTYYRYERRSHFVLAVHGTARDEKEQTLYLAVEFAVDDGAVNTVQDCCQRWVESLHPLGENAVQEALHDLGWMGGLRSWEEIQPYMKLTILQRRAVRGAH